MSILEIYKKSLDEGKEIPRDLWAEDIEKKLREVLTYLIEEKYKYTVEDIYNNINEDWFLENKLNVFLELGEGDVLSELLLVYNDKLISFLYKYKKNTRLSYEDTFHMLWYFRNKYNLDAEDLNCLDSASIDLTGYKYLYSKFNLYEVLEFAFKDYNKYDNLGSSRYFNTVDLLNTIFRRYLRCNENIDTITEDWLKENYLWRTYKSLEVYEPFICGYITIDKLKRLIKMHENEIDKNNIRKCNQEELNKRYCKYRNRNWLLEQEIDLPILKWW